MMSIHIIFYFVCDENHCDHVICEIRCNVICAIRCNVISNVMLYVQYGVMLLTQIILHFVCDEKRALLFCIKSLLQFLWLLFNNKHIFPSAISGLVQYWSD